MTRVSFKSKTINKTKMEGRINCLHICNDLLGSKVHENLYNCLEEKKISQIIFYQIRPKNKIKSELPNFIFKAIPSVKLKTYHRLFFRNKIKFLYQDLLNKVDISNIQLIHATTLFTDGALAYKLHQKFKIPYILAVRGSDIDFFMKFRKDLIPLAIKILTNSSKIIFISNAISNRFFQKSWAKNLKIELEIKSKIILNGIDEFWINNRSLEIENKKRDNILYIGNFGNNKNVLGLLKAVLELKNKHPKVKIFLVGKNDSKNKKIKQLIEQNSQYIKYLGPIYDKTELLNLYRSSSIFAMPSFSETFGLVYLEALSQGLPVICSKDQGIDGVFKSKIGEFVQPSSVKSIENGLDLIISNYSIYNNLINLDLSRFKWKEVSKEYFSIYNQIVMNNNE